MFRTLSRCRTGMFIVAGTLVASGLMARETRTLRAPVQTAREIIQTPGLDEQLPSVELQFELLHERLKAMGDRPDGLYEPFDAFRTALLEGQIDDTAIWLTVATMPDLEVQAKAEWVMRDFAARILNGQLGIPMTELEMAVRPLSMRDGVYVPEFPGIPESPEAKALCNSCTTANTIANPTATCQFISGNTTTACPSDFYQTTLVAGTTYQFTMCTATCAGASFSYDTRIIIRNTACTILVNNDDFCGLGSQAQYTPTVTGTYIIEVTGFTASNVGNYTMGYRSLATTSCGSCATPSGTLNPTTTCQTVSGNNIACPNSSTATTTSGGVWYNVNLVGGRAYTFSTCPNNAAGGSCFGTATFDTRLDLWNSTCTTRLAGNDDISCSLIFRSAFLYTAPTTGTYKMQVRGFSGDTGSYTLAYQELSGCRAPVITSNTPTTGTTNTTNCSRTQSFSVRLSPLTTLPVSGTWSISAPAGASASPSSGAMSFSGTNGSFSSTLTKPACGLTNFTVSVNITNSCGSASRTWTYQLRDATLPTIVGCPGTLTLDCAAPDPPPASPTATDNCDPAPTMTFAETRVAGNCPGNFTTRRTWTARDCNNNARTCTQNILHRDTTPPTLSGVDEFCLWPANHEYYCLPSDSLTPTLTDNCSLPVSLIVVGCISNEPDNGTGDGDFPNDCVVSPDGKEVCIRSERAGNLNSRVYAILGIAVDSCGNRSAPAPVALVTVPHDDREHPECREPNSGLDKRF